MIKVPWNEFDKRCVSGAVTLFRKKKLAASIISLTLNDVNFSISLAVTSLSCCLQHFNASIICWGHFFLFSFFCQQGEWLHPFLTDHSQHSFSLLHLNFSNVSSYTACSWGIVYLKGWSLSILALRSNMQ